MDSPFDHSKDAMNKWDGGNPENIKASYSGVDNRTNQNNKDIGVCISAKS